MNLSETQSERREDTVALGIGAADVVALLLSSSISHAETLSTLLTGGGARWCGSLCVTLYGSGYTTGGPIGKEQRFKREKQTQTIIIAGQHITIFLSTGSPEMPPRKWPSQGSILQIESTCKRRRSIPAACEPSRWYRMLYVAACSRRSISSFKRPRREGASACGYVVAVQTCSAGWVIGWSLVFRRGESSEGI